MNAPKYRDGVTQMAGAHSRALDSNGIPVGTRMSMEIQADGTMGDVIVSKLLDHTEAHVRRQSAGGVPFLCSWQGDKVSFMDKTLPFSTRPFALVGDATLAFGQPLIHQISNSAYVGDGWMAGVAATSEFQRGDGYFTPVLTRLPLCRPAYTKEEFFKAKEEERAKMSLRFDPIAYPLTEFVSNIGMDPATRRGVTYVVPLGWKDETERYIFAVVMTSIALTPAPLRQRTYLRPRIWICSTGTGEATALPDGLTLDWPWVPPDAASPNSSYSTKCSHVACTAPGRLEFIVFEPESNERSFSVFHQGNSPASYMYSGYATGVDVYPFGGPGGLPGLVPGLPGAWGPAFLPARPYPMTWVPIDPPDPRAPGYWLYSEEDIESPRYAYTEVRVYFNLTTYVARRPSFFVARSDDFGSTWSRSNEPSFEAGSLEEAPQEAAFDSLSGFAAGDPYPGDPYGLEAYGFGTEIVVDQSTENLTYGPGLPWPVTRYTPRFRRPSGGIPFPRPGVYANRGTVNRPTVEAMALIGAGATTFAVVAGCTDLVTYETTSLNDFDAWDKSYLVGSFFAAAANPSFQTEFTPVLKTDVQNSMKANPQLYRRTGGGFARVAWPGDDAASLLSTGSGFTFAQIGSLAPQRESPLIPWDEVSEFLRPLVPGTPAVPGVFGVAWASTGEGCAVFFLVAYTLTRPEDQFPVDNPVIAIATVDGGQSWQVRLIEGAMNLRDFCVISDKEGTSILFIGAATDGSGKRQMWRFAADFTGVSKYGSPFAPTRPGLVNFKKYVHPGFPGQYDEPEEVET